MLCRFAKSSYKSIMASQARQVSFLVTICLLAYVTVFFIPVRNVVLQYYIRKAWRDVSTSDIIKIHYIRPSVPPEIYTQVTCIQKKIPKLTRKELESTKILVPRASWDVGLIHDALSKGHGRYLPVLKKEGKLDYLYLFQTMREVLDNHNIPFFMTAGSILGAMRHGGFIPWDDDLDIGIDIKRWEEVKQHLSCIEGFTLEIFGPFHWKFHFVDRWYPFNDIFFYDKNGPYLYAMTHYISHTFIYPEEMVFPLVEVDFEGITMPMPGQGLEIARRIYDFSQCVASRGHVSVNRTLTDVYPDGYSKDNLPCSDLLYLYPNLSNLECDCQHDDDKKLKKL